MSDVEEKEDPKHGDAPTAPSPPAPTAEPRPKRRFAWGRWAFLAVPLVGLLELVLHVKQVYGVVPESDWVAAKAALEGMVQPDDLVVVAPRWADPLGRRYFGDRILTVEREARPDETAFPRAIEVSIRGEHAPELSGWQRIDRRSVGAITISTLANPSPVTVIDRLLARQGPDRMQVFRVDSGRETECTWTRAAPQTGNLGFGPAVPGDRFQCPGGGSVGISIIATLDYTPRRCIYAPPVGGASSALRIRFKDVTFGQLLHGHHGIYVEAERHKNGAPVSLTFSVDGVPLGKVTHADGDGWKSFDLPTYELAGQRKDLVAEITSTNSQRRMYCFEADTR